MEIPSWSISFQSYNNTMKPVFVKSIIVRWRLSPSKGSSWENGKFPSDLSSGIEIFFTKMRLIPTLNDHHLSRAEDRINYFSHDFKLPCRLEIGDARPTAHLLYLIKVIATRWQNPLNLLPILIFPSQIWYDILKVFENRGKRGKSWNSQRL